MVTFRTNIDNNEYINIDSFDLIQIIISKEIPNNIREYANDIDVGLLHFERANKLEYVSEIVLKKDSLLGKYLLDNQNVDYIRNDDLYIYSEDIINSVSIALFEENEMFDALNKVFRKMKEGTTLDLSKKYGSEVINYISNNKDIKVYIEKLKGTYKPKEYIVYEDGEFSKKILLSKEKQKIK